MGAKQPAKIVPEMTPLELAKGLEVTAMWRAKCPDKGDGKLFREAASYLRKIASGEYAPVVHGRWVKQNCQVGEVEYVCSLCRGDAPAEYGQYTWIQSEHCPSCGALMDESRDGNSLNGKEPNHA